MWRREAVTAVVVDVQGIPGTNNPSGLIIKEHVADSAAESIQPSEANHPGEGTPYSTTARDASKEDNLLSQPSLNALVDSVGGWTVPPTD
jgi:hypothetical protein